MISNNILKKSLYFDVETAGCKEKFVELQRENPRLAKLWEKRCKWLAQNSGDDAKYYTPEDFWSEKSSLHPEFGIIVCVSFGAYDNKGDFKVQSFVGEEKEILTNANKVLNNAWNKSWKLAGHTIKNFDVPFIGKRMAIHGINPSPLIFSLNRKPWDSPFLDISEIFSFGGWGQVHTSLDLMACSLDIPSPKDEMDGSLVHRYFYEGRIAEIKKYCELDVDVLNKCFEAICFDAPKKDEDDFDDYDEDDDEDTIIYHSTNKREFSSSVGEGHPDF
jgi:predicted PolB exonuclease-like 3'-5' exonuclease